MTVYGRGRTRQQPELDAAVSLIDPKVGEKIVRDPATGRRVIAGGHRWKIINTPLSELHLPVVEAVQGRIAAGETEPVVVEWGCGDGTAIEELAERFPQARCYGYAREHYKKWDNSTSVKYIHAPTGELRRYLKDETVDVVYSRMAMGYLQRNPEVYHREIEGLIPKLKHGGSMILDKMSAEFDSLKQREDIELNESGTDFSGNIHHRVIIKRK
jgi:hypothetical protein